MKSLKRAAIAITLVGVLAGLVGTAAAQDYPPNTLTVEGFGQAFGSPDVAVVQMGVQTSSEDVSEAYANANTQIQNVIDALVAMGIEQRDIQTTGLYLYQDTPYNPQTGEPSETPIYRVQNSLTVTVRDVSQAGEAISTGVAAGANNIGGLTFSIDDPAALEQEARAAAIEDARTRAEELAGLMGVTLGTPTIVVEAPSGQGGPFFYDRAQAMGLGGGGASVEEGQLSVAVIVRVSFNIQ